MKTTDVATATTEAEASATQVVKKRKVRQPSNRIPAAVAELNTMSHGLIAGVEDEQVSVKLNASTGPNLKAALASVEATQAIHHGLIAHRTSTLQLTLRRVDKEGRKYISDAKKVIQIQLGTSWSTKHYQAGFLTDTMMTPRTQAQREGLIQVMATYFGADAMREAENQGVTAARGAFLHAAIVQAHKDLNDNKAAQKKARTERDKAVRKLRKVIRRLVIDLEIELEADSPDWTRFGLIPPAQLNRRKRAGRKENAAAASASAPVAARTSESAGNGESVLVALAQ